MKSKERSYTVLPRTSLRRKNHAKILLTGSNEARSRGYREDRELPTAKEVGWLNPILSSLSTEMRPYKLMLLAISRTTVIQAVIEEHYSKYPNITSAELSRCTLLTRIMNLQSTLPLQRPGLISMQLEQNSMSNLMRRRRSSTLAMTSTSTVTP